jgi:hypothetical protein
VLNSKSSLFLEESMSLTKERLITSALLIVIGFLVTAFIIASARSKISMNASQLAPPTVQGLPTRLPIGRVQVVRFTLYDAGIYPSEANAQAGLVAISIEDLSGASSGLVVERREGDVITQLGRVDRLPNRLRARGDIVMTPGRYEVYDASHPTNRSLLIVEP